MQTILVAWVKSKATSNLWISKLGLYILLRSDLFQGHCIAANVKVMQHRMILVTIGYYKVFMKQRFLSKNDYALDVTCLLFFFLQQTVYVIVKFYLLLCNWIILTNMIMIYIYIAALTRKCFGCLLYSLDEPEICKNKSIKIQVCKVQQCIVLRIFKTSLILKIWQMIFTLKEVFLKNNFLNILLTTK
jgi:hypothetical protein